MKADHSAFHNPGGYSPKITPVRNQSHVHTNLGVSSIDHLKHFASKTHSHQYKVGENKIPGYTLVMSCPSWLIHLTHGDIQYQVHEE